MSIATDANVRTTQAADKEGLSVALRVAFTGGAVMGFVVSMIYVYLLIRMRRVYPYIAGCIVYVYIICI